MFWFWLNIPLSAVFFLAMTLIPLWMVFKHPDTGPDIPAPDEHPPVHAASATADPAAADGATVPAIPACQPDHACEEALAGLVAGRDGGEFAELVAERSERCNVEAEDAPGGSRNDSRSLPRLSSSHAR